MQGPIFTLRPWQTGDGDAGDPTQLDGVHAAHRLCRRLGADLRHRERPLL